jgi:tellurite resistance protein TerC
VEVTIWFWVLFNIFVLGMLALDLGVFHREAHEVSLREAGIWSIAWVSLAMVFNVGIYLFWGSRPALEFLTGYLIEKSLSMDNVFVFAMIFSYFAVPKAYQHRVLFWGILGALVMRAALIGAGSYLVKQFQWVLLIFGVFLIYTGIKMARQKSHGVHPERNPLVRLLKRVVPVTDGFRGAKFFVRENGRRFATPLLVVLVMVEASDLMFAIDSVPAIFAVTQEPFLVYTSNVFAILGLRSLYFLLAGVIDRFRYLKLGLSALLVFVGIKMLLIEWYKIPIGISLGAIAGILTVSIVASLLATRRDERRGGEISESVSRTTSENPGV